MSKDNNTDLHKLFPGVEPRPPAFTRIDVEEQLGAVAGDRIVGKLGGNLPDAFIEMTLLEMEIEEFGVQLRERAVERVKNLILEGHLDMNTLMASALDHGLFDNEMEAATIFEKQALYYKMHSDFWYNVRTLFDCWNDWLSIRHDFHVVSTGKKFTNAK